jgi:hypothetical protein
MDEDDVKIILKNNRELAELVLSRRKGQHSQT